MTIDCADPARLAEFWAEALGYRLQDPPAGFDSWEQALDALGIPPERRNDASAVVDPEGSGRVLPRLSRTVASPRRPVTLAECPKVTPYGCTPGGCTRRWRGRH